MYLVWNERWKLLATCMNNLAVAFVVAGDIAPLIAGIFGASVPAHDGTLFRGMFLCFYPGVALHTAGQAFFRNLRP